MPLRLRRSPRPCSSASRPDGARRNPGVIGTADFGLSGLHPATRLQVVLMPPISHAGNGHTRGSNSRPATRQPAFSITRKYLGQPLLREPLPISQTPHKGENREPGGHHGRSKTTSVTDEFKSEAVRLTRRSAVLCLLRLGTASLAPEHARELGPRNYRRGPPPP